MADTALLVALAIGLKFLSDVIPFLNLANGGTIDLAMVVIMIMAFRNGPKYSFVGATVFWFICWWIGGFKIYSGIPALEIIFDRAFPYTLGYGMVGLFYKSRNNRIKATLVILLAGIIRLFFHTTIGVFEWYSLTKVSDFFTFFWASFLYNITYVGLTTILAMILFNAIFRVAYFKAPLELPPKKEEAKNI